MPPEVTANQWSQAYQAATRGSIHYQNPGFRERFSSAVSNITEKTFLGQKLYGDRRVLGVPIAEVVADMAVGFTAKQALRGAVMAGTASTLGAFGAAVAAGAVVGGSAAGLKEWGRQVGENWRQPLPPEAVGRLDKIRERLKDLKPNDWKRVGMATARGAVFGAAGGFIGAVVADVLFGTTGSNAPFPAPEGAAQVPEVPPPSVEPPPAEVATPSAEIPETVPAVETVTVEPTEPVAAETVSPEATQPVDTAPTVTNTATPSPTEFVSSTTPTDVSASGPGLATPTETATPPVPPTITPTTELPGIGTPEPETPTPTTDTSSTDTTPPALTQPAQPPLTGEAPPPSGSELPPAQAAPGVGEPASDISGLTHETSEYINNLGDYAMVEGDNPWRVAEGILHTADPNRTFSNAEIQTLTKAICEKSDIGGVWGMTGSINHTEIPIGHVLKVDDPDVKSVLANVLKGGK